MIKQSWILCLDFKKGGGEPRWPWIVWDFHQCNIVSMRTSENLKNHMNLPYTKYEIDWRILEFAADTHKGQMASTMHLTLLKKI